ncbi:hypothetical protein Cch01nite_40350 [Cellulomonas chitinilytica]|uniref:Uncharacterized protein n=1 Tax=Cellulomonas chitinilytica TaxID=398759 RepID=A0A919P826_9CELL|nr:hypothetical protein [Cellulomonas chitinilytica]GIG23311.1 hypothetical protein Cch01nite_40350 [Cellulomonas chitinilytica]
MSARAEAAAFGDEVMNVSDELEIRQLLRDARDEAAAVAGIEDGVARLRRARDAQSALAQLPPDRLRAAIELRRIELDGAPR